MYTLKEDPRANAGSRFLDGTTLDFVDGECDLPSMYLHNGFF